jgi:hypothetical protein
MTDYAQLPPNGRNILRLMFTNPHVRTAQEDWKSVARAVVAMFRADAARAGADEAITELVEDLSRLSPEFEALWREKNISAPGEGLKRIKHPELGLLELEFSVFAVDGRPDLGLLVYNPVTPAGAQRLRAFIAAQSA